MGSGNRSQIFTFTEDIGLACRLAITNQSEGIYNIAGENSIKMKELAHKIVYLTKGSRSKIVFSGTVTLMRENRKTFQLKKLEKS